MSGSFLNAFMPTLPWWFLALALTALASWAVTAAVRLWNARRYEIQHPRTLMIKASDALAAVISDPGLGDSTKDQAIAAYEAVENALNKEKELS